MVPLRRQNYPKYSMFTDFGVHFGTMCMFVSRGGAFCSRCVFFENLGGTPLDRFWPPLGHPWFEFVDFWKVLIELLLQTSKVPVQRRELTTPSQQKKHGFKQIPIISPNKSCFTFACLSRVSPQPKVLNE